jgi:hypothetical protein
VGRRFDYGQCQNKLVAIGDTWQNPAIRRCGSKRVFPSLAAAESRARRASLRAKRLLLAYPCPDCGFFHLGYADLVAELIPRQAPIPHPVELCAYCNLRHVSESKVQEEKADPARYCSEDCQCLAALLQRSHDRLKNSYRGPRAGAFTTYGVIDPRTGHFVYIGQTSNFEHRKGAHLRRPEDGRKRQKRAGKNIDNWTHDALVAGIAPVIVPLETVSTWQESLKSELNWVRQLSAENHPLLNLWPEHREAIKMAIASDSGRPRTVPAHISHLPKKPEPIASHPKTEKHRLQKQDRVARGNLGRSWTKTFDEELIAHFKSGAGAIEIALRTERTPAAVRARLVRLGLIQERKNLPN